MLSKFLLLGIAFDVDVDIDVDVDVENAFSKYIDHSPRLVEGRILATIQHVANTSETIEMLI